MRLRHIEVIQALLQTGHLGTAAEVLELPATAVEACLREVEGQLGFMLFASVRGRLQATVEARALQVQIAHVVDALEPVQRLADSLKQYQAPPLRVICTPPLAQQLLLPLLLMPLNIGVRPEVSDIKDPKNLNKDFQWQNGKPPPGGTPPPAPPGPAPRAPQPRR